MNPEPSDVNSKESTGALNPEDEKPCAITPKPQTEVQNPETRFHTPSIGEGGGDLRFGCGVEGFPPHL